MHDMPLADDANSPSTAESMAVRNDIDTLDNRHTLLVLGAGPKGIAIAAKNAMMRQLGYAVPRVIVVDRQGVAAHWSGDFGFTDGKQPLGTRPEKDIGYPYAS